MAAYRVIWKAFCGVLITAGVVISMAVLPLMVWLLATILAIVLALTAVAGRSAADKQAGTSPVGTLLRTLSICLAVVAALGLGAVLRGGVVLLLLLVGASSPRALGWWSRPLRRQLTPAAPLMPAPPPPGTRSTSELCREWHETYLLLRQATKPTAQLRIVMARQRCLDELERRDPDGLHAWLASTASADGDPRRFLSKSRSDSPPDQRLP
jgi:hypothetical protein